MSLHTVPIILEKLVYPRPDGDERFDGDDTGYRHVISREWWEPLVQLEANPNLIIRPVYAGYSRIHGWFDLTEVLPGTTGNTLYVRKAVAEWIKRLSDYVSRKHGYKLIVVDGFRHYETQASGFSRLFLDMLWNRSTLSEIYWAWLRADWIFSFVDTQKMDLSWGSHREREIALIAEKVQKSPSEVKQELQTMFYNLALYRKSTNIAVPFIPEVDQLIQDSPENIFYFQNNAHAGGGAVDIFLWKEHAGNIVPINHVPFDFCGKNGESTIDFLEKRENWEMYRTLAKKDERVRTYLKSIWVDPDDIPDTQFIEWQSAIRILYNWVKRMWGTTYNGENWHFNFWNIVLDPENNEEIHRGLCTQIQEKTGNSCQAILIHGPEKGIQTFTGNGAHEILRWVYWSK